MMLRSYSLPFHLGRLTYRTRVHQNGRYIQWQPMVLPHDNSILSGSRSGCTNLISLPTDEAIVLSSGSDNDANDAHVNCRNSVQCQNRESEEKHVEWYHYSRETGGTEASKSEPSADESGIALEIPSHSKGEQQT